MIDDYFYLDQEVRLDFNKTQKIKSGYSIFGEK